MHWAYVVRKISVIGKQHWKFCDSLRSACTPVETIEIARSACLAKRECFDEDLCTWTFGMKIPHSLQFATHLSPIMSECAQESLMRFGGRLTWRRGTYGDWT